MLGCALSCDAVWTAWGGTRLSHMTVEQRKEHRFAATALAEQSEMFCGGDLFNTAEDVQKYRWIS